MMAVTAVSALAIAAFREEARSRVGCVVVGTCVALLTYELSANDLAARKSRGLMTGPSRLLRIVAAASAQAVFVLGIPDAVFLIIYDTYMGLAFAVIATDHWRPWDEPRHIVVATVVGVAAALRTVSVTGRGGLPPAPASVMTTPVRDESVP